MEFIPCKKMSDAELIFSKTHKILTEYRGVNIYESYYEDTLLYVFWYSDSCDDLYCSGIKELNRVIYIIDGLFTKI